MPGLVQDFLVGHGCRPGTRIECRSPCALCGACGAAPASAAAEFHRRSHAALVEGTWRHVEVCPKH